MRATLVATSLVALMSRELQMLVSQDAACLLEQPDATRLAARDLWWGWQAGDLFGHGQRINSHGLENA
jgi:hypothetical protein